MLKPTNSAAEQIVSLRSVNGDIDIQIASLQATQQRNLDTITAFEEIATWEEVVEDVPVVEEVIPDPTPVVEEPVVVPTEPVIENVVVEPDPVVDPTPAPVTDEPVQAAPRTSKKKR